MQREFPGICAFLPLAHFKCRRLSSSRRQWRRQQRRESSIDESSVALMQWMSLGCCLSFDLNNELIFCLCLNFIKSIYFFIRLFLRSRIVMAFGCTIRGRDWIAMPFPCRCIAFGQNGFHFDDAERTIKAIWLIIIWFKSPRFRRPSDRGDRHIQGNCGGAKSKTFSTGLLWFENIKWPEIAFLFSFNRTVISFASQ